MKYSMQEALDRVRAVAPEYVDDTTATAAANVRGDMPGWMAVHATTTELPVNAAGLHAMAAMLVAELTRTDGLRPQITYRLLARLGEMRRTLHQNEFIKRVPSVRAYER